MDLLKYLPGRLVPPAECLWMHERTKRVDRSTHGQWSADRATFPFRYGLCFGVHVTRSQASQKWVTSTVNTCACANTAPIHQLVKRRVRDRENIGWADGLRSNFVKGQGSS
jgi:hypothetical protein